MGFDKGVRLGWWAAIAAALATLAVVLWGGYSHRWGWTGINGHTATLWDWLHLLLLPAAVGVLPIWLSRRTRVQPRHKSAALAAVGVFAVLVLIGYVVPWAWTGFSGNRLWDWLELLALPVAVALTPILGELRAAWRRGHSLLAGAGLAVFTVVVLGGYLWGWNWTGFKGNRLWDWLHLLLLPLLLPVVVVHALQPMARARVTVIEDVNADAPKDAHAHTDAADDAGEDTDIGGPGATVGRRGARRAAARAPGRSQ